MKTLQATSSIAKTTNPRCREVRLNLAIRCQSSLIVVLIIARLRAAETVAISAIPFFTGSLLPERLGGHGQDRRPRQQLLVGEECLVGK
jgi:hypothetical protein